MKVFAIIVGILLTICGVSCIFTPFVTFLQAGYFLVILLLTYGIMGIIKAVKLKNYNSEFVFSILSIILGLIIMFVPGLKLMTDGVLAYLMAIWFLLQGALSIFMAFRKKKAESGKVWIWTLVVGILGVLVGLYSFAHPMVMAFTFGILIGIYFIECGISMVVMSHYFGSK